MRQAVCANMGFLDVDLTRQSIRERLSTSPFYRSDTDTIFIAEGVLMYLTADEAAAIFRFMSGGGESKRRVANVYGAGFKLSPGLPQFQSRCGFLAPSSR